MTFIRFKFFYARNQRCYDLYNYLPPLIRHWEL